MKGLAATFILFCLIAGHEPPVTLTAPGTAKYSKGPKAGSTVVVVPQALPIPVPDTIIAKIKNEEPIIQPGPTNPIAIVAFAKTLIGTPYLYGSTDPQKGFDCSGFITYVFNHFHIKVPRSSVQFADVGREVNFQTAKPGDLILFTGTDSTIRIIGHMGIVVSNKNDTLHFIHSTSGKQYGVTITELSPYYMSRFVKVTRVFPDESSVVAASLNEVKTIDGSKNRIDPNGSKQIENKTMIKSGNQPTGVETKIRQPVKITKGSKQTGKKKKSLSNKKVTIKSRSKKISIHSRSLPEKIQKKKRHQSMRKQRQ